eukprot:TRINITY_DN447_c0_g1_i16.p1 TRINITY_DN447_c0_g1~~TRINITY_DN447_c0_g1_i16.p1  ORF type:complete len:495 (+),score=32.19 TRINITY_DN447_c0_g1_i16:60-1544(+)
MLHPILLFTSVFIISYLPRALSQQVVSMNCYPVISYVMFDLNPIQNTSQDYRIFLTENRSDWISWNLCTYTRDYCPKKPSYANKFIGQNTSCLHLTSDYSVSYMNYTLLDLDNPEKGLKIDFQAGDVINANLSANTSTFSLEIQCDRNTNKTQYISHSENQGAYNVQIKTSAGCPRLNPSDIWSFVSSNKWLFAIISFILGVILCFMGYRLINLTFFLLGFCISFIPFLYICFAFFITPTTPLGIKWAMILLSIILGGIFGFICVQLEPVAFFAIGVGLAYVATSLLYVSVIAWITLTYAEALFFVVWVILSIAFGYFVVKHPEFLVILTSSIYGAYLMVKPMLFAIVDLPEESELLKKIQIGELSSIPWQIYLNIGLVLLFSVIGFVVQWKMKQAKGDEPAPSYYHRMRYSSDHTPRAAPADIYLKKNSASAKEEEAPPQRKDSKSQLISQSPRKDSKTELIDQLPRKESNICLLYTSPSPRDRQKSRMPSSA